MDYTKEWTFPWLCLLFNISSPYFWYCHLEIRSRMLCWRGEIEPPWKKYISSPVPLLFVAISSGIICVKISKMLELPKISCSFPLVLIERPSKSGVRAWRAWNLTGKEHNELTEANRIWVQVTSFGPQSRWSSYFPFVLKPIALDFLLHEIK